MNTENLYQYITEEFNVDITALRIIDDILCYTERNFCTEEMASEFIYTMISSIGIEQNEILSYLEN